MEAPSITSRKNPLVRHAASLGGSAEQRRAEGKFLCEGARLCRDAAVSGLEIEQCFFTAQAEKKYGKYFGEVRAAAKESYLVEEPVAQLLSDTRNYQGIFCVCRKPKGQSGIIGFSPKQSCLVLENLQDPGNLGTILRTAEALGAFRVFLLGTCCDPFSPKVLRASMGAVFRLSLSSWEAADPLFELLSRYGYKLHAAVPDDAAIPVSNVDFSEGLHGIFVGNEGNGLLPETIARCHDRITIPMAGRAESLNASAAATILLWEMCRGLSSERSGSDG